MCSSFAAVRDLTCKCPPGRGSRRIYPPTTVEVMMLVTVSACKSGSGMQTANKHVRDVVAMSGKAGSEGIARASGLLLAEKYSRRRCKQEKEMGDFHPVHLRGCDCDLLRPIHGTTSAFCCLPSTAGWLRFNREIPYSPRCECEQNPPLGELHNVNPILWGI